MRATKRNRCCDRGVSQQNLIDFVRRDILPSANDDVFHPARQMQITVRVEVPFVAGAEPSSHESTSVRFRIVFVSTKHIRSLNSDLASLVSAEVIAGFVHDA